MVELAAYKRAGTWAALPDAPTGVSGIFGNGQVSLTWTAPAATGGYSITDYSIQYSSDSGSTWTMFSRSVSTATNGTVTGLTNSTAYVFRVATVTTLGMGAYSTASSSVTPLSFNPMAVILTSGTSYTVPSGASTMKAWAVGQGSIAYDRNNTGAGGCSYKTWSVTGGSSVAYSVGNYTGVISAGVGRVGNNTTITYGGVTITGSGGGLPAGGSYSGGDGGMTGGGGSSGSPGYLHYTGAVGGNGTRAACGRTRMTDVSGLISAVSLAGGKTTEDCGASAAFGSGGYYDSKYGTTVAGGLGCGNGDGSNVFRTSGAVVLYFT
jgi:hypothetical protein